MKVVKKDDVNEALNTPEMKEALGQLKENKEPEDKVILKIKGSIDYEIEYLESGNVKMNYGDNPQNKLVGLSMAGDIMDYRLDITRKVSKDHPAWLSTPVRGQLGAAINIIRQTVQSYAGALFNAEMDKKEKKNKQ